MKQQTRRETTLLPLLLEEEEVLSKYGNDHPKVKSIRRRIESTKEFLQKLVEFEMQELEADEDLDGLVSSEEAAQKWYKKLATMYVSSLQQNLLQLQEEARSLDELFIQEATAAKQLSEHQFQDESFRKDLDRTRKLFEVVVKNLDEVSFVEGYEGYIYEELAAAALGRQVAPSLGKIMALGVVLSCLAGFGFAYLIDHNVIQVTSPRPSDGKSTLASNLAVTIARSGKSVLLIDADLRRPRQHKLFGLDSAIGLASVVENGTEPSDAYQPIPGCDNLWIMSCGPRPKNPSELLSSSKFTAVLGFLRERFDFLIVDTPPVLAVSDPSAVAGQVDGVLLCLQIDNQARPVAPRACDMLREAGAELTGVVINAIGSGVSSYVYNYHAKRYGYDYAYKYGERVLDHGEAPQFTNGSAAGNGEAHGNAEAVGNGEAVGELVPPRKDSLDA